MSTTFQFVRTRWNFILAEFVSFALFPMVWMSLNHIWRVIETLKNGSAGATFSPKWISWSWISAQGRCWLWMGFEPIIRIATHDSPFQQFSAELGAKLQAKKEGEEARLKDSIVNAKKKKNPESDAHGINYARQRFLGRNLSTVNHRGRPPLHVGKNSNVQFDQSSQLGCFNCGDPIRNWKMAPCLQTSKKLLGTDWNNLPKWMGNLLGTLISCWLFCASNFTMTFQLWSTRSRMRVNNPTRKLFRTYSTMVKYPFSSWNREKLIPMASNKKRLKKLLLRSYRGRLLSRYPSKVLLENFCWRGCLWSNQRCCKLERRRVTWRSDYFWRQPQRHSNQLQGNAECISWRLYWYWRST